MILNVMNKGNKITNVTSEFVVIRRENGEVDLRGT